MLYSFLHTSKGRAWLSNKTRSRQQVSWEYLQLGAHKATHSINKPAATSDRKVIGI